MSFFEYYAIHHFSLEAVLQDIAKNNPTENQIDTKIQVKLKHVPV